MLLMSIVDHEITNLFTFLLENVDFFEKARDGDFKDHLLQVFVFIELVKE